MSSNRDFCTFLTFQRQRENAETLVTSDIVCSTKTALRKLLDLGPKCFLINMGPSFLPFALCYFKPDLHSTTVTIARSDECDLITRVLRTYCNIREAIATRNCTI